MNVPIHAQSLAMRVNIPFEFHAGENTLPAGTYSVERRGDAILISDGKLHAVAVLSNAKHSKVPNVDSTVVFRCYGNERFLTEVRWSDHSMVRGLMESKAERKLANAIAAEPLKLAAIIR
jgi:hypothetical protein